MFIAGSIIMVKTNIRNEIACTRIVPVVIVCVNGIKGGNNAIFAKSKVALEPILKDKGHHNDEVRRRAGQILLTSTDMIDKVSVRFS
jgi:hypothetical protein